MIDRSESPRSAKAGAGKAGGGVDARDGSGEDAREESFGGVGDCACSRVADGGGSRR